jgi:adenylate cyclase
MNLFRFKHFQSRLLVFFLVPLLLVLAAVYVAVNRANTRNALDLINKDLERGAFAFVTSIDSRNYTLAIAGDVVSDDYATRQAYATNDPTTIQSALQNLQERLLLADFIVMVDEASGTVDASSLETPQPGTTPVWGPLIEQARALDRLGEYPEAAGIMLIEGRPFHVTVVPFFGPDLLAWIALGFEISSEFTASIAASVVTDFTVLFRDGDGSWRSNGSTLSGAMVEQLAAGFDPGTITDQSRIIRLADEEYVALARQLSTDGSVFVVLQRSLTAQLAPFEALRQLLFTIFALGLVVLTLGVLATSRKVTRPVQQLAAGARRIEAGDYQQTVDIPLYDEIGELAQAFNGMAKGLAEKEKVRNLLGKVVSPEVASELLSRDIELGGEEREVTILFCDVRGFTSLCEGQSPKQILSLLNEYFSAITGVIESNGGVVDKFIGDAVMALFGAPVAQPDAPARAVRTAIGMRQALAGVNAAFATRDLKPIAIGIGLNTDRVVAGNMGSKSRLNYTVIGDGVNLASRLEGLTKVYGATIIVSEPCARAAPGFVYQELDRVRVKGKQEPVRIFEPLCATEDAPAALAQQLGCFDAFLQAYREGRFTTASALLDEYESRGNPVLAALYRARLQDLGHNPPPHWDGIHTFSEK